MKGSLSRLILALVMVAMASSLAFAQSASSSLAGTVVDSSGGVLPGVSVTLKNLSSGVSKDDVTNSTGAFGFPSLDPGDYTLTVSLTGFKKKVENVHLLTATNSSLKVSLEVGNMTDVTTVTAGVDLITTQSTTVQATVTAEQMASLPLVTRNALNFVEFLPGVDTAANHQQRDSTMMGLPQSAIAITIDGVNVQDQVLKSTDGFFAIIRPQLDMVEEVTVSEATPGADSSGQGAVQIKFVTRSGSNQESGSAYEFYRNPALNSNAFFNVVNNLPKNSIILNQYGFRQGGPLTIPGVFDGHGKVFYFVNYEEFRLPSSITRTRTALTSAAETGVFDWTCTAAGCAHSVNLFTVPGLTGGTLDPTVNAFLHTVNTAITGTPNGLIAPGITPLQGAINQNTDLNTVNYLFLPPANRVEHNPAARVDLNLSNKHKLTATYTFQKVNSVPDELNSEEVRFPGFPVAGNQTSFRNQGSDTLRSTLTKNLVNELSFGFLWSPVYFGLGVTPASYSSELGDQISIPSVGGNTPTGISADGQNNAQSRNGKNWNLNDTVSWLKGSHSLSFGENFTQVQSWLSDNSFVVPEAFLGVQTTVDPADAAFTTTNFPGATSTELNSARSLYAILTGRVTATEAQVALNPATGQYVYLGPTLENVRMNEFGLFGQDTWRVKPNFTINAGVRYDVQYPFTSDTSVYSTNTFADLCGVSGAGTAPSTLPAGAFALTQGCAIAQPGKVLPGSTTVVQNGVSTVVPAGTPFYEQYNGGSPGYNVDYHSVAPNVGMAWQPNVQHGIGRWLLGDPAQATIRASLGRAYNRDGLEEFLPTVEGNPGLQQLAVRDNANANLGPFPVTYTSALTSGNLAPPAICSPAGTTSSIGTCFPSNPVYPMNVAFTGGVRGFDPNYKTPYTNSASIGFQRALSKDMAIEIRYVGTRNHNGSANVPIDEIDQLYNCPAGNTWCGTSTSFLNEFQKAQTNLLANIAAGKGNTFAYTGAAGTQPLPIFLASYEAKGVALSTDPTQYTASQFTNTTLTGALGLINPSPTTFASTNGTNGLFGSTTFRANGVAAGLPVNFWVDNPNTSSSSELSSFTFSRYNSMQIDVRRRLSRGLQFDVNYTLASRFQSTFDSIYIPLGIARSTGETPNALKIIANYDIPVGRGKRFGANMNKWLDGAIGGWSLNMTGRVQNGQVVDYGAVQLVGITQKQLQSVFKYYKGADGFYYDLPQNIITNTIMAFSTSSTSSTGYGSLGPPPAGGQYIAPPSTFTGSSYATSVPTCTFEATGITNYCGLPRDLYLVAPVFTRFDMSVKKTFPFAKRANFQLEVDVLNVFNAIDFNPTISTSTTMSNWRVTSAYSDINNTFDPGGRIGQLAFRVNW